MTSQRWLEVTANNLANVSTNGFKRDGLVFNEAMERAMAADGGTGRRLGSVGMGSIAKGEFTVFELGSMSYTGNPLDVAIDSPRGTFAVQTPNGIRYTRDGALQLNADRQITTKEGFPVLDTNRQPITVPPGLIEIENSGRISVNGNAVGQLAVWDGNFVKEGDNLFVANNAQMMPEETTKIRQSSLEQSNVNAVEAMISMITIGRSYEMAQKSMNAQDELTQRLIQSLSER